MKLQSFAMLPELLGSLAARVEEVATQTTRTVERVRDLLDAMRQPAATGPAATEEIVPLQELSIHASPALFKRPRAGRS